MKQSDVTKWLFGELQQILIDVDETGITSQSDLDGHVDIADGEIDHPYPFIGVQTITNSPLSAGIGGGELHVDNETVDQNGVTTAIEYRKDGRIRYDLIPVTDGRPQLRDNLGDQISTHFGLLARTDGFPEDITPYQIGENTPQDRPDDIVRATGIPLELKYRTYTTDTDPDVATEVNVDIDVSGSKDGAIDDTDTDADGYDETFN